MDVSGVLFQINVYVKKNNSNMVDNTFGKHKL